MDDLFISILNDICGKEQINPDVEQLSYWVNSPIKANTETNIAREKDKYISKLRAEIREKKLTIKTLTNENEFYKDIIKRLAYLLGGRICVGSIEHHVKYDLSFERNLNDELIVVIKENK